MARRRRCRARPRRGPGRGAVRRRAVVGGVERRPLRRGAARRRGGARRPSPDQRPRRAVLVARQPRAATATPSVAPRVGSALSASAMIRAAVAARRRRRPRPPRCSGSPSGTAVSSTAARTPRATANAAGAPALTSSAAKRRSPSGTRTSERRRRRAHRPRDRGRDAQPRGRVLHGVEVVDLDQEQRGALVVAHAAGELRGEDAHEDPRLTPAAARLLDLHDELARGRLLADDRDRQRRGDDPAVGGEEPPLEAHDLVVARDEARGAVEQVVGMGQAVDRELARRVAREAEQARQRGVDLEQPAVG